MTHVRTFPYFNPRSPCGERQIRSTGLSSVGAFQSTLPVWGATNVSYIFFLNYTISIHAPRVGSDSALRSGLQGTCHFNPRSPCGERQGLENAPTVDAVISIHAPRVGSDSTESDRTCSTSPFQSTLPVWGATGLLRHTPALAQNFNPRSPCGERPPALTGQGLPGSFQSTLPVWGATTALLSRNLCGRISIHAPRVGSDRVGHKLPGVGADFNPRSPCGERRHLPQGQ